MLSDLHYALDILLNVRFEVDGVAYEKVMKVKRLTPAEMGVFSSPGSASAVSLVCCALLPL